MRVAHTRSMAATACPTISGLISRWVTNRSCVGAMAIVRMSSSRNRCASVFAGNAGSTSTITILVSTGMIL